MKFEAHFVLVELALPAQESIAQRDDLISKWPICGVASPRGAKLSLELADSVIDMAPIACQTESSAAIVNSLALHGTLRLLSIMWSFWHRL